MVSKTLSFCFILPKVGYVGGNVLVDAVLQCFSAAVARIGCYFFYGKVMLL